VIAIFPNLMFAVLFFQHTGAQQTQKVIRSFYLGEALKWLLTIGLFTIALQWSKLRALPMLLAFLVLHVVYWVIPFISKKPS
jgi:ATP synthase protein I